jgi:hypothetical protein
MALRLPAKVLVIALVGLLATAGLTWAAEQSLTSTPATRASEAAPVQKRAVLVVPDLRRQAFVFAKGALQDTGFAWQVVGGVHGFAANVVAAQAPPAGTRVIDTGAPLVKLTLSRNAKYPQTGVPQDLSPYHATAVQLADAAGFTAPAAPAEPTTTTTTPAATVPATTTPATTTPAATTSAAAQAATPAAKPKVAAAAPKTQYPQSRPPAFTVAGAPKEPLDEMPLPERAAALDTWLAAHPKPTNVTVRHWLYQNEWIVTGAKFGWWRGAEALRKLIVVDRRAVKLWGIGSKSKGAAARALAEVETRSK